MTTGFSLFLIAVGAILAWAVTYTVEGVDVNAVGFILMLVGAAGLLLSLLFWSSFSPFPQEVPWAARRQTNRVVVHEQQPQRETVVVREAAPPPPRVVIRESAPTETVIRNDDIGREPPPQH